MRTKQENLDYQKEYNTRPHVIEKRKAYSKKYYQKNKEKMRAYQHEYYWEVHYDKYSQYFKEYRQKNQAAMRENSKRWLTKGKEINNSESLNVEASSLKV